MTNSIDISHLSPPECILLAEKLWEKARYQPDAIPLTLSQETELNSRLNALEAGKLPPAESWDKVKGFLQSL